MREFRFAWKRFCKCSEGAIRISVSLMQSEEWRSLSPAARATFVVLAYYAGMKEKRAFCAQGLIAHLAGIGRQRCNEALSELSRAGLITNGRRGFERTNQYTVPRSNGKGDFLKKSRKYVLNLARSGKLEAYRVGREYRFSEGHLLAYLGSTTTATRRSPTRAGSAVTTTGTLTEREIEARAGRFLARAEQRRGLTS